MIHFSILGGSFVEDVLNIEMSGLCEVMLLNFSAPSKYMLNLHFAHLAARAPFSV